jgi:hypothetical protein
MATERMTLRRSVGHGAQPQCDASSSCVSSLTILLDHPSAQHHAHATCEHREHCISLHSRSTNYVASSVAESLGSIHPRVYP